MPPQQRFDASDPSTEVAAIIVATLAVTAIIVVEIIASAFARAIFALAVIAVASAAPTTAAVIVVPDSFVVIRITSGPTLAGARGRPGHPEFRARKRRNPQPNKG